MFSHLKIIPADSARSRQVPLMVLSGQTERINRSAATFELTANQYVQQLRSTGSIHASISVPNTAKYKNASKKPLPASEGTNALVIGSIRHNGSQAGHMDHKLEEDEETTMQAVAGPIDSFNLDLETVLFYPRFPSIPVFSKSIRLLLPWMFR